MNKPEKQSAQFEALKQLLPAEISSFLRDKRWFGGKALRVRSIDIEDAVPVLGPGVSALFVFANVYYQDAPSETYVIPIEARSEEIEFSVPLSDALKNGEISRALYDAIDHQAVLAGALGEIRGSQTTFFRSHSALDSREIVPKSVETEQSNTSIIFGQKWILKVFRRVQDGINPELEVGRFLTERTRFRHFAPVGGWLDYHGRSGPNRTVGVLQSFISNEGDAWNYTLKALSEFWREAPKRFEQIAEASAKYLPSRSLTNEEIPDVAGHLCGDYLDDAALLGRRTAELHQALASAPDDPAFAPEPFTNDFQTHIRDTLISSANTTIELLRSQLELFAPGIRGRAEMVLDGREKIISAIRNAFSRPLTGMRIRIHGDCHLGQILRTGNDFIIIDFEGEPGRPISERVVKRSALQDVAGMLRSFHYAAFGPLLAPIGSFEVPRGDPMQLAVLARYWNHWVTRRFLRGYFETAGNASFLPSSEAERQSMLQVSLLSKSLFELSYEMNNRPDWLRVPLAGLTEYLENPGSIVG